MLEVCFKIILSCLQGQGLPLGALAILAIVTLLASSLFIERRYARLRNIPGPALSKVTSLHLGLYDLSYDRNNAILDWHRKHGPIVCIAPNEVSVATLEATKVIYGARHGWAKSDYFDLFKGFNMRSVFATKSYEAHRTKRKLISAFYQASNIYTMPHIEAHIQERCRTFMKQVQNGQVVDVYALTDRFAFDIITYLAFGPDHASTSIEFDCQERDILLELKQQQFANLLRVRFPVLLEFVSVLLGRLSSKFGYLSAEEKLASWCQARISAAMKDSRTAKAHCLLQILRESHTTENGIEKCLDQRYVAAEILDNINAAEATTAVTATYFIWTLSKNPLWQFKIRQELAALPIQDDGSISFADVNTKAPSLEACLREVYRLHPASSGRSERVVPRGGYELSGFYLPGGTVVSTSVVALHRDESVFPDAGSFLPERWLDVDKKTLGNCEAQLIPFGYGGRICLGKALATMQIKLLLAHLYLRYRTEPTEMTGEASMRQCSTHDAVPHGISCLIRCHAVAQD
jgi:cytochrome P450